ncbi:MAG: hypothetical protein J7497_16520, partial [Chitinophagaceae bacterium]|nr:hypothetical protein [Chitinophagaceae bacterium]
MRSTLLLALALFPCYLFSQQVEKHITYGGENIGFYEYKPADYNSNTSTKYPVIIFLHGIGERGNGTSELYKVKNIGIPRYIVSGEPMRFYKNGKWYSFIVLSPQCSMKYGMWTTNYIDGMMDYAEKNLRIDKSRIYLTGLSMGGGGTWKWISASEKNASKVAAIATVCAPATLTNPCVVAKTKLPMWSFHATNDATVSVSVINNAINAVLGCNPAIKPIKTVWSSGGHAIWDRAYDRGHTYQTPNVFEWFLGYTRDVASTDNNNASKPPPVQGSQSNKSPVIITKEDNVVMTLPWNSVTLQAWKTYDPDGWISSFKWQKISGPGNSRIETPTKASTKISNLKAGWYWFRITAFDNKGVNNFKNIRVIVNPPKYANRATIENEPSDSLNILTSARISVYPNPAKSFINIA